MGSLAHSLGLDSARHRTILAVLLAALGLAAAFAADAAAGSPTCGGRRATIVSDRGTIVGTKAPDVIVAGPASNVIEGEGGNDRICGGGGDDTILGGRGTDTVLGQGGDDTISGERGSDELKGGAGTDRLLGESGNDRLDGGAGDRDSLEGGPGDDHLSGGAGDFDVLAGGPGNDGIDGGPGSHDIVSYAEAGRAVTIDLQAGAVSGAEDERLSGIEDAIGGSGADALTGADATPNRLDGGPGDDRLAAAGGGDEAFGGPGADQCSGPFGAAVSCGPARAGGGGVAVEMYESIDGAGSLIITGTEGPDAVSVSFSAGQYLVQGTAAGERVLSGDPGSAECTAGAGGVSVSCSGTVSLILASMLAGDDSLTIDESVPATVSGTLDGGPGADTVLGGRGTDVIYGGDDQDPDALSGGAGDDTIFGISIFHPQHSSGAATMSGGPGNDLMVGGQPCEGDSFDGGTGENDSASFARVRNEGVFVAATIGGLVLDPDVSGCTPGRIDPSTEKIEGTTGPDLLSGDGGPNTLLGRGGDDRLDGGGGVDICDGGTGRDSASRCESTPAVP